MPDAQSQHSDNVAMNGPSEKAIETAMAAAPNRATVAECAVHVAYPVIRTDVIAEVVEALRAASRDIWPGAQGGVLAAADYIEREFGEDRA